MDFLRNPFGKKTGGSATPDSPPEKEHVICPACGAGYNTEMVLTSILMKSPFMEDLENWNTRVTCRNCQNEILVNGSYKRVFGQPRPKA